MFISQCIVGMKEYSFIISLKLLIQEEKIIKYKKVEILRKYIAHFLPRVKPVDDNISYHLLFSLNNYS